MTTSASRANILRLALFAVLICSLSAVLGGCGGAGSDGAQGETQTRPSDFAITYSWREGSLPPEYYSEYEIAIGPGNEGVIRYSPTYPGEGVPEWARSFAFSTEDLDKLFEFAQADDALRSDWNRLESPLVGGPSEQATIVADGRSYVIPSDLTDGEAASVAGLYDAITSLVPEHVWVELERKRTAFLEQQ